MSYQVGDNAQFEINTIAGPVDNVYAYVWRFWDASIQVGTNGTISKRINMGGDPSNGNSLVYQCSPVMKDGSSVNLYGTIVANNPPFIAPSPSVTVNDDYYGYKTVLSARAYSIDGHTPILFLWYEGATCISAGTNGASGPVNHTWYGNDTSVSGVYTAQENHFETKVYADRTITLKAIDTDNGTIAVDFRLRGKPVPPLSGVLVADGNSVTTDATSQPRQRIGPGQTVTFVAYVKDIDNVYPSFTWTFAAAPPGNWTVPYVGSGLGALLPDGSFSNTIVKDVSTEVVSAGTVKVCVATCRITGTNTNSRSYGQTTELQFTVELVKNQLPSSTTIVCQNAANNTVVDMTSGNVAAGTKLIYSAVSTDADLDVVNQRWSVENYPVSYLNPLYENGPKIVVDTTGYAPGSRPAGHITSTDRMGGVLGPLAWSGPNIT